MRPPLFLLIHYLMPHSEYDVATERLQLTMADNRRYSLLAEAGLNKYRLLTSVPHVSSTYTVRHRNEHVVGCAPKNT